MSPTNMPKSMFRLLNWAAEEDKDFPDVDPKKVILRKLQIIDK